MYTNIDTTHSLATLEKWLELHEQELPKGFPTEMVIEASRLIMTSNVFQFDDTYWLQKTGTAMGTNMACIYATIYYSYHEETSLLPVYSATSTTSRPLLLHARLIDDAFQIWDTALLGHNLPLRELPTVLKTKMAFGILDWDVEPPTRDCNFLDLNITIDSGGDIVTKTYVKAMNLHLYIPPHSAHTPGVLKSLIFGNILRYWLQNTKINTFVSTTRDFYRHLLNRGYRDEVIAPIFYKAAESIDAAKQKLAESPNGMPPQKQKAAGDRLFMHWDYHPRDITRHQIRKAYEDTLAPILKGTLGVRQFTLAYHNPMSLSGCLTKTQLEEPAGHRVSDSIQQLMSISLTPADTD